VVAAVVAVNPVEMVALVVQAQLLFNTQVLKQPWEEA
jgi:hypothetical protein